LKKFSEKQQIKDGFINGGFFIFKKSFFKISEKTRRLFSGTGADEGTYQR